MILGSGPSNSLESVISKHVFFFFFPPAQYPGIVTGSLGYALPGIVPMVASWTKNP